MSTLNSYLNFNGNCFEAFEFYKSVFGGEYAMVMKNSDVPASADNPDPGNPDGIMHMALPVGEHSILMGSDCPPAYGQVSFGSNYTISITAKDRDDADRLYQGLSAGGNAAMPMADAFWGSYFGMLEDKFKVQWMISFDKGYSM